MSRFQAKTNAVLDRELEELREHLGLAANQKADLLREVSALAAWVVRQAEAGRSIEARKGDAVEPLRHPVLDRLRAHRETAALTRVALTDDEVERLARALDRGFEPTPALRTALRNLSDVKRRPPRLRWKKRPSDR